MTEHLGPDGLLEPEVINPAPLVLAVASAGLFISCAIGAWVLRKLLASGAEYGSTRGCPTGEYWRY